jgi:ADP-heptose:LPS heptosyltransferase
MSAPAPRLLVIRRRYLGDIVLLGSVFRNLRQHWPAARVTALVEPPYAGVLALNPDVDAVLSIAPSPGSPAAWWRLLRTLRAGRFTHVLDFDNTDKTALLARFTGAPFRATLHLENVRRHFPSLYTATAFVSSPDYSAQSITETYLRLLVSAGVPVATRLVRLVPRAEDLAFTRGLLAQGPGVPEAEPTNPNTKPKTLLVHPGSRSPFRLWPPERFGEVCRRVKIELGARVVLIAGPGEEDVLHQVLSHAGTDPMVIDQPLAVPQFAALAAQVDLLLCHDSGPMHLAAAVGTPVVALYGSQNATVWRPLGDFHTVLQPPMPCRNCVAPDACVPGDSYRNYCIRNLGVDQVFAAIRAQLARPADPS